MMGLKVSPLSKAFNRSFFNCGVPELDIFIQKFALQNQKKMYSKTYVAHATDSDEIMGYYTITAAEIIQKALPENINHPRYPVSAARICRLVVNNQHKGAGIGAYLLKDALLKIVAAAQIMGVFAVIVDAKSDEAKAFYKNYGFIELTGQSLQLILAVATIEKAVQENL
ncbi:MULTISPECIES: GNAT family N-acetyltransferase [Cysteiniphilum]|uniref:GNAT family N-acetyltransferase n=1 Tax=Cysteiniphilum TaxID=2056696 RepID=UPI0017868A21|nr:MULTISPECIES: GNAT family N-acetyltransferase [Cysteiniphilum]